MIFKTIFIQHGVDDTYILDWKKYLLLFYTYKKTNFDNIYPVCRIKTNFQIN